VAVVVKKLANWSFLTGNFTTWQLFTGKQWPAAGKALVNLAWCCNFSRNTMQHPQHKKIAPHVQGYGSTFIYRSCG
jgi:hypothetical protein